ncbi:hybrid sensor histidine kinase/response regulator [candidate division KSB1 bacterium]|nr:hybrid sensor histidine kinase/response regulator [candidate division KSB1 bacterium]
MVSNEEAFFKELLSMYKIEAEEHLKAISSGLLKLEKTVKVMDQIPIVETIYREAHSLKGASRAVNLIDVETVCQSVETVFSALKHQQIDITPELFDVLHQSVDTVSGLIESPEKTEISDIMRKLTALEKTILSSSSKKTESTSARTGQEAEKIKQTKTISKQMEEPDQIDTAPESEPTIVASDDSTRSAMPKEFEKALVSDTIRISTSKLDSILLQTEEMLSTKLAVLQQSKDHKELLLEVATLRKGWEKQEVDFRGTAKEFESNGNETDSAMIQSQMLLINSLMLENLIVFKDFEDKLSNLSSLTDNNARSFGGMLDTLLEDMKKLLMLPFSTLLRILPKVVRDLSRDQGKDVELIVKGSTIEIDRRILEELKDPFIHILRNCIDHGIEKPDERLKNKKPKGGTISIAISQLSANQIEIIIVDDGGGIDPDKVREVVAKKGIISKSEADQLDDQEAVMLIFQSEVSTSPIITDLSGRGLGLPIVREKVENLGGSITIQTEVGEGTTFRILLPVTVAKFRGILIQVQDQYFIIPTTNVERVIRFNHEDVQLIENKESILMDGRMLALTRFQDVLELPEKKSIHPDSDSVRALVLSSADKRVAFTCDRVLSEQEVLVKNLGRQLIRVRNIAGATILGDGKVVSILNVPDLVKSAAKVVSVSTRRAKMEEEKLEKKRILVAEDSITSRTLLKNILESAGYEVQTTVDGMDAISALKSATFDLVVSDIEMPRMNGFDLVTKIRADRSTAELPVVLVTALESREDRERGIDVGANAYIVKRSFDQSNLLDVIKKLI